MADRFPIDVTAVGDIIGSVPVEDDDDNPYDHARRVLRSNWMKEHDEAVAAKAWETGYRDGMDGIIRRNPYRKEAPHV